MKAMLTSLKNPKWSNAEHTAIDCEITTSQFGDEVLPFTACKYDIEPHGREIFENIVSGNYGPIADYAPPAIETLPPSKLMNLDGEIRSTVL